ncbi:uncharacterized protein TNCV_3539201 [Trichonephila clavipes]|nr:uncharacterized protein TNCV_3539201 [Trichonephila clavipes]
MQQPVCYRDLKTSTQNYIHRVWQETWDQQILNKLHNIHLSTSHWAALPMQRHDVRLTRLRIGHTRFTHRHLLLGYISTTEKLPHHRIRDHCEQLSKFERSPIIGLKEADWENWRVTRHIDRICAAIRRCWQEWMNNARFQRYDCSD